MVRINLLPPEIIERRKYERYYPYIFVSGAILLVVVLGVWGFAKYIAFTSQSDLQQIQDSTAKIQAQAETFRIFEQQQQELAARKTIADTALANRINMGGFAYDLSLILPDEVWLQSLSASDKEGLIFSAYTPDEGSVTLGDGYKSVAATLVRLSALPQLADVWLTGAQAQDFSGFAESNEATTAVIGFSASARITTETPRAAGR